MYFADILNNTHLSQLVYLNAYHMLAMKMECALHWFPRIKQAICNEMGWKRISSLDNALQKLLAGKYFLE